MTDYKKYKNEFRIRTMPEKLKEDINNIAANKGVTTNGYVKEILKKAVDETPEHFKKPPSKH
jgi:predicted HicB family RNase H-like nuclease